MQRAPQEEAPTIIKKYANRRLYDTATSSYITLDDLCEMVKLDTPFIVQDAKTGSDLTRQVLTQIIVEQESRGTNLLPISFLRSIIRAYDSEATKALPPYLEAMMENFVKNQQHFTDVIEKSVSGYSPFAQFEEMSRQNMELFQQAFAAFNPFEEKEKK